MRESTGCLREGEAQGRREVRRRIRVHGAEARAALREPRRDKMTGEWNGRGESSGWCCAARARSGPSTCRT
jgi:hypothetical protein